MKCRKKHSVQVGSKFIPLPGCHCVYHFQAKFYYVFHVLTGGWSGGAIVLGKLPVPGRPTILITVGQGPIALAVGACGGGLNMFTLICSFSSFLPPFGRRPDID